MLTPKEVAAAAVKTLDAKQAKDITLLRTADVTVLADYFVICTGTSNTQINALCDAVEKAINEGGEPTLHREGYRGGTWVLLDFGSIVVHVFSNEAREFYSLERLWQDGTPLDVSEFLAAE